MTDTTLELPTETVVDDTAEKERVAATLQLIRDVKAESVQARTETNGDGGMSLEERWMRNGNLSLGNQWLIGKPAGLTEGFNLVGFGFGNQPQVSLKSASNRVTLNRIGPAIVSNVASQTSDPLVFLLQPVEMSDEPEVWLRKRGVRKVKQVLDQQMAEYEAAAQMAMNPQPMPDGTPMPQMPMPQPPQNPLMSLTPEQTVGDANNLGDGPTAPLTDEQADYVQTLIDQGLMSEDDVVKLTDDRVTRAGQTVFDDRWALANGEMRSVEAVYLCNVFGHEPPRIQWFSDGPFKNTFQIVNENIMNVWPDPRCSWIDQMSYLHFEYLSWLDEATAFDPDNAAKYEKAAKKGTIDNGSRASLDKNTDFKRPMVVVAVTWIRNQRVPMTVDEAIEAELVMLAPSAIDSATGQQMPGTGFVLTAGGEPTVPPDRKTGKASPNWPTTIGIRQIKSLLDADEVLEDMRCPYLDIPFGWCINIPRPYSPFGQGEPERLEDPQGQINRILSLVGIHLGYYAFPVRYWKESTLNMLQEHGTQLHLEPGVNVPIPDEEYDMLVAQHRICITQDIVVMPQWMMQMLDMLLDMIDKEAGNVGVRQGESPTSGASNKLAQTLLEASNQPLELKAKYYEWTFERLARIGFECVVQWMDESEWLNILGGEYSLPVIRSIIEKLKHGKRNFRVEGSRGRGRGREKAAKEAMAKWNGGNPRRLISDRAAMIDVGVNNPDAMAKEISRENAKSAMSQTGVAEGVGAPGGEQPQEKKEPKEAA